MSTIQEDMLYSELQQCLVRIADLEEALKPFAELADRWNTAHPDWADSVPVFSGYSFPTMGDIRKVRGLL